MWTPEVNRPHAAGDAQSVNNRAILSLVASAVQRVRAHLGRGLGWLLLSRSYLASVSDEEMAARAIGTRAAELRARKRASFRARDDAAQRDFADSIRSIRLRGAAHLGQLARGREAGLRAGIVRAAVHSFSADEQAIAREWHRDQAPPSGLERRRPADDSAGAPGLSSAE